MDTKGRPTAADISDVEALRIIRHSTKTWAALNFPAKVKAAKCAKLAKRGLLEVTADNWPRWLTRKGEEALAKPA